MKNILVSLLVLFSTILSAAPQSKSGQVGFYQATGVAGTNRFLWDRTNDWLVLTHGALVFGTNKPAVVAEIIRAISDSTAGDPSARTVTIEANNSGAGAYGGALLNVNNAGDASFTMYNHIAFEYGVEFNIRAADGVTPFTFNATINHTTGSLFSISNLDRDRFDISHDGMIWSATNKFAFATTTNIWPLTNAVAGQVLTSAGGAGAQLYWSTASGGSGPSFADLVWTNDLGVVKLVQWPTTVFFDITNQVFNAGSGNVISNGATHIRVFGYDNSVNGNISDAFVVGYANSTEGDSPDDTYIIGSDNHVNSDSGLTQHTYILGVGNTNNGGSRNFFFGRENFAKAGSVDSVFIGRSNTNEAGDVVLIGVGNWRESGATTPTVLIGKDNRASGNRIVGIGEYVKPDANDAVLIGIGTSAASPLGNYDSLGVDIGVGTVPQFRVDADGAHIIDSGFSFVGDFTPSVADGASAVAWNFGTKNALTTVGALITQFQNAGVSHFTVAPTNGVATPAITAYGAVSKAWQFGAGSNTVDVLLRATNMAEVTIEGVGAVLIPYALK